MKLYHTELVTLLQKLDYPNPLPTLRDIRRQFKDCGLYTALIGILEQNNRVLDEHLLDVKIGVLFLTPDVSERGKKLRAKALSQPKATIITKFLIEYFYKNGFFDLK